jgi:2-(1,2-epoxy-1,2-dihydrophenyl)acetyl-CoA isomerase
MLTGGEIPADEAKKMGIINKMALDNLLLEEAHSLATTLAEGPAIEMGLTKRLTNRSVLADINEILEMEGLAQGICFQTEDFKEGAEAFFEKCKPKFN